MTVLRTLKILPCNVESVFKSALNKIADNPKVDRHTTLFKQAFCHRTRLVIKHASGQASRQGRCVARACPSTGQG